MLSRALSLRQKGLCVSNPAAHFSEMFHLTNCKGWVGNMTRSSNKFCFIFWERIGTLICVSLSVLGRIHATDYSNASATGIFDSYQVCCWSCLCTVSVFGVLVFFPHVIVIWFLFIFLQMCWSSFLCSLVSLPLSIFPKVEDTGWVVCIQFCLTSHSHKF